MHKLRLLLLALLFTLPLVGCERYVTVESRFWKVIATDYRGNVISEHIAVDLDKIEGGYSLLAIERTNPEELAHYNARYVIGRRLTVQAPNFSIYRVPPPDWLYGIDLTVQTVEEEVIYFGK